MSRRHIPVVRPPMHAGGGVGDPFGTSGAPGMPPSESAERARDEAIERYALARGRFFERIFRFPDFQILTALGPTTDTQQIDVKSNGDSFVRLVAIRGIVNTFGALPSGTNHEAANTFLQLEIDGLESFMTSGRVELPASFAILFSETAAPWLWLSAPPIIRVGETLSANVRVNAANMPPEVGWQPELALRLVDDNVWCALYGS